MLKKIVSVARYEPGTKTIRSVPENYWLASMDSWDSAVDHERMAYIFAAAPELLEALDDLLAFHDYTHPRHAALLEEYQEFCTAIEMPAKGTDLLDDLQRTARAAITKAKGE